MDTISDKNVNIIKDIPPIPDLLYKINEAIKEQDGLVEKLVSYIEEDEELKEDVIKLAKSRLYSSGQNFASVKSVILALGVLKIKNIILTLSLKKIMDITQNNFTDLWEHSVKTAIACGIMANENSIINTDDAFTLGLLHDIGKALIYKNNSDAYNNCNKKVKCTEEDIIGIENEIFNTNHAIEGALILKKWGMPKTIIDCVKYHHTPTLSTIPSASGIIYIADKISGSQIQEPAIENAMINRLGICINDIKNLKLNVEVKSGFFFEDISN